MDPDPHFMTRIRKLAGKCKPPRDSPGQNGGGGSDSYPHDMLDTVPRHPFPITHIYPCPPSPSLLCVLSDPNCMCVCKDDIKVDFFICCLHSLTPGTWASRSGLWIHLAETTLRLDTAGKKFFLLSFSCEKIGYLVGTDPYGSNLTISNNK